MCVHSVCMKAATSSRPVRVFRNGNSLAVRLPKGWATAGTVMQAKQKGQSIILEKTTAKPKTLAEVLERMRAAGPDPGPFIRVQPPYPVRDFD